mmetsp:Transcript_33377/g.110377  ORF Transcript_33377/g.110377 Transcript_33377/m.110377 type:complete len:231 (-) Transcript_33377:2224-2916(-)
MHAEAFELPPPVAAWACAIGSRNGVIESSEKIGVVRVFKQLRPSLLALLWRVPTSQSVAAESVGRHAEPLRGAAGVHDALRSALCWRPRACAVRGTARKPFPLCDSQPRNRAAKSELVAFDQRKVRVQLWQHGRHSLHPVVEMRTNILDGGDRFLQHLAPDGGTAAGLGLLLVLLYLGREGMGVRRPPAIQRIKGTCCERSLVSHVLLLLTNRAPGRRLVKTVGDERPPM